jgi:hypothetical protein
MADRDQYRGYGNPSGRYYEGREYDRGGDRDRSYAGRDQSDWRGGSRDDNRGFFERAGDEIRSWFGDDDYRGDRDYGRGEARNRDYGNDRTSMASGRDSRDRDFRQDAREPWGGGDRGGQNSSGSRYGAGDSYRGGFSPMGNDSNRSSGRNRFGSQPHDDHYGEWRQQQIDALDRDYDDYRRENRDRFHSEFSSWRGQRQQQRTSLRDVREHMDVVGSDGEHVGTVDKVTGDRIVLTKSDTAAGGHHHSIPCAWIQTVDDKVTINKTAEQARTQWRDEENRRALFESDDQRRDEGPHILDRSFSGTYNYR